MGMFSLGIVRKALAALGQVRAIFRSMIRGFFWIVLFEERRETERLKNDLLRAEVMRLDFALDEDILRLMESYGASRTALRRMVKELAVANMRKHASVQTGRLCAVAGGKTGMRRSGRRAVADRRMQILAADSKYSRRIDDAKA